ncbi:hypothetical protein Vadar_022491 [Vaccinium darrowii]|uniref:Uncharacterized protein n=1 Tax=Vaccinium darrowii TaxID=229202 RepID=A0ACB7YYD9_9ERIC|nr:hypothetical protein Vadar_022491 [Vaccinium darrowii]
MKSKWRREMGWLFSPTNYMVELVPAKQHSANGRTMVQLKTRYPNLAQTFLDVVKTQYGKELVNGDNSQSVDLVTYYNNNRAAFCEDFGESTIKMGKFALARW